MSRFDITGDINPKGERTPTQWLVCTVLAFSVVTLVAVTAPKPADDAAVRAVGQAAQKHAQSGCR